MEYLAFSLLGLVIGFLSCYLLVCRPLLARYDRVVQHLYNMKLQGFVPQFDIQQRRTPDLSEEIREF